MAVGLSGARPRRGGGAGSRGRSRAAGRKGISSQERDDVGGEAVEPSQCRRGTQATATGTATMGDGASQGPRVGAEGAAGRQRRDSRGRMGVGEGGFARRAAGKEKGGRD